MSSLMAPLHLTLSDPQSQSQDHSDFEYQHMCMIYTYLLAAYYHLNLDVIKRICWRRGFPLPQRSFLFNLI